MILDDLGLTDSRGGCYVLIAKNLFYRGNRTSYGRGMNCFLPYPLQTSALVGFRSFATGGVTEGTPLYLIPGVVGGTGPFERIAPILRIRWDIILFSYLTFYGLALLLIPILGFAIIKRHRESQKEGIFIAIILGTVAATCNTICNIIALSGLYIYWIVGSLIMNEDYLLPVLFSSMDLLGFVFWFLTVGAFLYCVSKRAQFSSSHRGKLLPTGDNYLSDVDWFSLTWMFLMFLSCCISLSLIFALMQWNLFGPSHII